MPRRGRKGSKMALKNIVVKDNGNSVVVYTDMPAGVVKPDAYTKLDQKASTEIRKNLAEFRNGYLLDNLKADGRAVMGRKNSNKKHVRSIVAEFIARTSDKPEPQARTRNAGPSKAEQDEAIARNEKIDAAVKLLTDAGMSVDIAQIAALAK